MNTAGEGTRHRAWADWGARGVRFVGCVAACLALCLVFVLSATPAALAGSAVKWPVDCEFRGLNEILAAHGVDEEHLPLFMAELAAHDELLVSASLYTTEDKDRDIHGFASPNGKALFVLTLNLENGVVLETRENICSWDFLDKCLRREVQAAIRTYEELNAKHGVKPGSRIVNL